MTPPKLLLASLGSCAGFYAAQYLKKNHLAAEGTVVRISAEKATNPPRLNDFHIQVEIPPGISDQHRQGIDAEGRRATTATEACTLKAA